MSKIIPKLSLFLCKDYLENSFDDTELTTKCSLKKYGHSKYSKRCLKVFTADSTYIYLRFTQ